MSADTLEELALRVEQATGPDRELDRAISGTLGDPDRPGLIDRYTASLDAAMSLKPEGWEPLIDYTQRNPVIVEMYGDGPIVRGGAVSGALALCAASLRARSAMDRSK